MCFVSCATWKNTRASFVTHERKCVGNRYLLQFQEKIHKTVPYTAHFLLHSIQNFFSCRLSWLKYYCVSHEYRVITDRVLCSMYWLATCILLIRINLKSANSLHTQVNTRRKLIFTVCEGTPLSRLLILNGILYHFVQQLERILCSRLFI